MINGNVNQVENIGARIAFYRKKRGLTQRDLAKAAGISLSYIGKIEASNVKAYGSLSSLYSIASALSIEPGYLLLPISEEVIK